MKIAITADVHLASEHPERFENFAALTREWEAEGIRHVIIAGDLFDAGMTGYKGVDALGARHPELTFHIIRGNHDISITQGMVASPNLRVYSEPAFETLGSRAFLFVPYEENGSAARLIARHGLADRIERNRTCLVMHGDIAGTGLEESGREGAYFPIAIPDRATFGFTRVFLGHIHRPHELDAGRFAYPGSPCPLDPTERGLRRWIRYDADRDMVESVPIGHGPVYDEFTLRVIPDGNEVRQVVTEIGAALAGALKGEVAIPASRLRIRVSLRGASSLPLGDLVAAAESALTKSGVTLERAIDSSGLALATQSPLLEEVATRALSALDAEYGSWSGTQFLPERDEIAAAILRTLYLETGKRRRA
jgi:predicted phosphodiesterase